MRVCARRAMAVRMLFSAVIFVLMNGDARLGGVWKNTEVRVFVGRESVKGGGDGEGRQEGASLGESAGMQGICW